METMDTLLLDGVKRLLDLDENNNFGISISRRGDQMYQVYIGNWPRNIDIYVTSSTPENALREALLRCDKELEKKKKKK